jgi:hypothetical protein
MLLACLLMAEPSAARADALTAAVSDLSAEGQARVTGSVKSFLRARPDDDRSAGSLGWDCQAALVLAELKVEGARERLAGIAESMAAAGARSRAGGKTVGWGAPEEVAKGACVPSKGAAGDPAQCAAGDTTVFGFQSGLGIACLAAAGAVLQRPALTDAARDAMRYWDQHRKAKAPCKDCTYFAMSDSARDSERWVRNMNLFIALGASELGRATNDPVALNTARTAVRADQWERESGNRGYLGKLDPLWTSRAGEAERIENHSAFMALLIDSIGRTLKDPAIDKHALTVWRDWATCDNKRCLTVGCKYWAGDPKQCQATATAVHCGFRKRDALARSSCESYLAQTKSVGSVGLWAALGAGAR